MEHKREKKPRKPRKKQLPEDTWQNLEYWIKRNPDKSLEECKKLREEKLRSHKLKKPSMLEYWIINNPDKSLEECKELHRQYGKDNNFQCIEYWIKRNPDKSLEECKKLLEEKQKEYLAKRPDNSGENNPGHRSKTTLEERKRRSPMCREFWELKYPDATPGEIDDILKKERIKIAKTHTPEKTSTRIEYWLAKGYSKEEAKQKLKERQSTFTLEKCIERYGEEKGRLVFKERQDKWQRSLTKTFIQNGDTRAVQSPVANELITRLYKEFGVDVPKHEFFIYDYDNGKFYNYDLKIDNKIIEFNGDFWHMNPRIYGAEFYNNKIKMTAAEKWGEDARRIKIAEDNGYKVMTVWEYDYKKDKENTFNSCVDFLKS